MIASSWLKGVIALLVTLGVFVTTVVFAVFHHDDGSSQISFDLTDQFGVRTTQQDLAGRHLLVFFGFTHCRNICPTQLSKLTTVMMNLEKSGLRHKVKPVFITVDPERDSVERISEYLKFFDKDFVGLTGSIPALKQAADRFKIVLGNAPADPTHGYQITHSSVVYVVDPFSRVIDYIALEETQSAMAKRIQALL